MKMARSDALKADMAGKAFRIRVYVAVRRGEPADAE
jgi:hypothetical protein